MNKKDVLAIEKFPLLAEDKNLTALKAKIIELNSNLDEKQKEFVDSIEITQSNCSHVWEEKRFPDSSAHFAERHGQLTGCGVHVLDSKICTQCGAKEERPSGESWETCYNCWGTMVYQRTIEDGGHQKEIFKCSKCGEKSWKYLDKV